jgi:hypothetical protein
MNTSALLAAIVAIALLPARADAQNLKLQIQDGRVTLEAQNVPVRQILAEWARVGGAKIINGEKVAGAPLTLQLQAMPERQALDIILRSVSGYMLAARQAGTGVSAFDRIMILPTSSAPRNAGPAPGGNAFGRPMPQPAMPVQAEPVEEEVVASDGDEVDNDSDTDTDEEDAEAEEEDAGGGEGEPTSSPQPQAPQMNRFQRRNAFPNPMGGQQVQPFMPQPGNVQVFPGQQGEEQENSEGADVPQATPGNPFGMPAGATATPGVVTPVPQQQQPGTRPRRPPSS